PAVAGGRESAEEANGGGEHGERNGVLQRGEGELADGVGRERVGVPVGGVALDREREVPCPRERREGDRKDRQVQEGEYQAPVDVVGKALGAGSCHRYLRPMIPSRSMRDRATNANAPMIAISDTDSADPRGQFWP